MQLGAPAVAIGRGPDRQPLWPRGTVGSITHCAGYCAAAAAWSKEVASIGIDAEVHDELPVGVLEQIALPHEADWIADRSSTGTHWGRVLFSAKESVFKTWFPLTRRWLGFHDAEIRFSPSMGEFDATLLVPGPFVSGCPHQSFSGRFLVCNGLVLTGIALTVDAPR